MAPHLLERTLIEPLLAVILGPTGSGKTLLSVEIATRFCGEIVNCDSVAIYRDIYIAAAKPSPEERSRAPHHLFDVVEPTHYTTAGEYARLGRSVLNEIKTRGNLPVVVGGTGLYLHALLEGLFPGPERSEALRQRLRSHAKANGPQYIHRILERLDCVAAAKIHAHDTPKLIRAIEVSLSSRRPITEQWKAGRDPLKGFRIIRIGLDPKRQELYARLNQRVHAMFEAGLVEETERLLQKYGPSASPLSSIGYKQVVALLTGEISREAAIAAIQQAHRNYAKRQMTWFRREPEINWISGFGSDPDVQQTAATLIQANITG